MTEREMLELAAKAVGASWDEDHAIWYSQDGSIGTRWNPLADDGDALRLATDLGISITPYPIYQHEKHSVIAKQRNIGDTLREPNPFEAMVLYGDDPYAATRLAITRAAAEIGKNMEGEKK